MGARFSLTPPSNLAPAHPQHCTALHCTAPEAPTQALHIRTPSGRRSPPPCNLCTGEAQAPAPPRLLHCSPRHPPRSGSGARHSRRPAPPQAARPWSGRTWSPPPAPLVAQPLGAPRRRRLTRPLLQLQVLRGRRRRCGPPSRGASSRAGLGIRGGSSREAAQAAGIRPQCTARGTSSISLTSPVGPPRAALHRGQLPPPGQGGASPLRGCGPPPCATCL